MSTDTGPWHESRQAWDRLEAWCRNPLSPAASYRDAGDGALRALADGGLVRRLLDQVEFEAVRSARKHGKSWAEIAVRLGVTRQSAWERWRDVDDVTNTAPAAPAVQGDTVRQFEDDYDEFQARLLTDPAVAAQIADELVPQMFTEAIVPRVIAMTRERARNVLDSAGLIATDPDGQPLRARDKPGDVVTDQNPDAGVTVTYGSMVMLWTDRRGGSGVREPRRPMPDPKTGRAMRDEATGDAVN